jgi:hypothetical protein
LIISIAHLFVIIPPPSPSQINNHLEVPSESQASSASVISDIVLGAHSVPKPVTSDMDRRDLCRSQSLYTRVVGLQKLLDLTSSQAKCDDTTGSAESQTDSKTETKTESTVEGTGGGGGVFNEQEFLAGIANPISSTTIQRECKELKSTESVVMRYTSSYATTATTLSASDDGLNGKLFVREFNVGEVCNLLAQLQASSLRVHSKKDWFTAHWERDLSLFPDPLPPPSLSVDGGERKSDFEVILDQLANVFSLGASFPDPTAEIEANQKASSLLAGLMWDEKAMTVCTVK